MPHRIRKTFRKEPVDTSLSEWLTTEQVARLLQINLQTSCKLVSSGELKASKVAHKFLIKRSDLDEFMTAKVFVPKISQSTAA